jgi:HEAT repeat protein
MDIWQRLQQAPDDLEGCTAALQHLFGAGQLYASLAATTRQQPNLLCKALPKFKEYLGYYAKSVDPYRNFACHCPLCRGEQGEHYLRVLNLAEAVLMAWHCSTASKPPVADSSGNPSIGSPDEMGGTSRREANPHTGSPHAVGGTSRRGASLGSPAIGSVEERLRQAAAYLHKAVQLLCPTTLPPTTISWSAAIPLRDLLAQYTAQHPDPALNLIDELLHFYQRGQWRDFARRVVATFPLAFGAGAGAIAKLALERTDARVPGFYPHPELLLATRWDEAFAQQFACAWEHHATDRSATLRWSLEPYRSEGTVWKGVAITGPSIGAAVGVALKCIENPNQPPPDIDCALTGELKPDSTLGSVGGYHQKTIPFDSYSTLRLVIPRCDEPLAHACLPDWCPRLLPAPDINQALQHATQLPTAVQRYLQQLIAKMDETPWYCNGQQLTNQRLFTPLRVLVTKPRRQEEGSRRPSEREGAEAQKEKPGDAYAELQAPLYELTREYAQKKEIRWEEFVRRVQHEKRAALIGAPGSGKTFVTRHLVLTLAQQAVQQLQNGAALDAIQIPLWLPASLLAEKGDLASAIAEYIAEYLPGAPPEWLQHTLEQGRFLLVIDALDELPETQQNRFKDCARQLDNTTGIVLVTCRTMHWEERSQWLGWKKLPDAAELAPLNLWEQRAIAERFFSANPRGAQAMQQRLRESYVLRHACRTPLLLTFACLLQSENQLRSDMTRAELYVHIVRRLLQGGWRNIATPPIATRVREAETLYLLDRIAWNLFRRSPERNLFTLEAWQRAATEATVELLETLEQLGVVVAAGYDWRGYPQWSFAHRSILEFLAARHLSRQENWREEISQHFWFQPEWWEVLTFLAGLVENADPLVERLEQEQDDLFGSMLLLQARVVGFGRVSDAVAQRITARAVQQYLHSEMTQQFTQPALQALGRHAVPHLIQAVQNEDYEVQVRWAACRALGWIGDPQAIPHLIQALQDRSGVVRRAACRALGWIGDPQAIPHLIQALQDRSGVARRAACRALGRIGDPQAIPHLIQALQDEMWWVRRAACQALGWIGDPQAIPHLIQALQDVDWDVRRAAFWALGEIGEQAIPHLIQALQDEMWWVREAACEALGWIGDPQAIPHLIQALQDEDRDVREAACLALGEIGDPQAIPHLIQALQDENERVRSEACEALGRIGDPQAIPHLIQALHDEDRDVREAACEALGRIGDPQAIPPLTQALQDEDCCVRAAACEALGRIGDPQAIPPLTQALHDEDRDVREAACLALGEIGDPQAIPHLIQALQDEDAWVRFTAFQALGRIDDPQAIPHLIQALQDENERVRSEACEALGRIGDPQAIPHLIQALQDENERVRSEACEALGRIGDPQAIPHLIQALQDGDKDVRGAACEALWRISRQHKIPIRAS